MAGKSYKWANPQTAPRSTSTDWDDIRAKILEYYDLKDKEPNESFYLQLYGGGVWLMNSRDETLQLDMNILSLEEAARLLEVLKATEDRVVGLRGPVSHYSDAGRAGATTSTPRDDDQTYSMNEITKLLRESTLAQVKLSERLVEGMKSLVEENAKMNQNFERFTTKISGDVQQLMRSVDSLKLRGQDGQAVKDWQEKPTLSANNKPSIVSCTRPAEPIKLHPRGRGRGFRPANRNPLTLLAPGPRELGPAEPRCSSTLVADSYEWNEKNEVRREQSPYKDWRVESAERLGIALDDLNVSRRFSDQDLTQLNKLNLFKSMNSGNTSINDAKLKQINITRMYKLKLDSEYAPFEDFLFSELKSRKLFYVFEKNNQSLICLDELEHDKNIIREIILNRIDDKYHLYTMNIKDPVELLDKIKEIKKNELRINAHTAQKRLFNLKLNKDKETAFNFCLRFEDLVRKYESNEGIEKMSDTAKKSLLFNAVEQAYPEIITAENVASHGTGRKYTYNELKDLIFQIDNSKQRTPEKSALLGFAEERNRSSDERYKSRERPNKRCERCGSTAHLSKDCKHDEPKCFNCNKFGHIAVDCSEPRKGPPRKRATDRNRSISPKRKQRREHSRSRSKSPFRRPGTPAKE
ncbi:uncharacterized protein LOC116416735 isoform X1 [Nasonia vitripennis]|uniref:CCHC-type domain-containing protein n=1 Tax=Nasonia vitripennis TaxID=7425 RepID=A0A7M7Q794_NASVI|nr:uncharacterized protein LOC116416735 isoform X1 [Nasonia vitripennis]